MTNKKIGYSTAIIIALVLFSIVLGLTFMLVGQENLRNQEDNVTTPVQIPLEQVYMDYFLKFDTNMKTFNITSFHTDLEPSFEKGNLIYLWKLYSKGKSEGDYSQFVLREKNFILIFGNETPIAGEIYYFTNHSVADAFNREFGSSIKSYDCGNFTLKTIKAENQKMHIRGYELTSPSANLVTTQIIISPYDYSIIYKSLIDFLKCKPR